MKTNILLVLRRSLGGMALLAAMPVLLWSAENPFLGRWALTIPGGGAGWLGVVEDQGQLKSSILWGGGSVVPVSSTQWEGDSLVLTRVSERRRKDPNTGQNVTEKTVETITAKVRGDNMDLSITRQEPNGKVSGPTAFTGKRIPPCRPNRI